MDLLLLGILHLCLSAYLHRQFAYGELTQVSEKTCICPGDIVSYECTVMSNFGGATTFTGPFFDCKGHGAQNNELTLFRKGFTSGGVSGTCNNGAIVGHSSSSENGVYTSQLDITVTLDLIGRTIECLHNNGTLRYEVGMAVIDETGRPSSSLDKIYISKVGFHPNQLTFHWNPVASDCSTVHYDIEASTDCGSCPNNTNHTNITCTDVDPISGRQCTFAVQTVVCGNVTGNASDPIRVVFYELTVTSVERQQPTEIQGTYNSDSIATVGVDNSETNIVAPYIITIGFLTATLLVCEVVSITAIAIILRRNKAKINAALESHRAEGTSRVRDEPMYEDVTGPLPSVSVINTQDNVAYGHTKTTTLKDPQH